MTLLEKDSIIKAATIPMNPTDLMYAGAELREAARDREYAIRGELAPMRTKIKFRGSMPCAGDCGRTVSANKGFCAACLDRVAGEAADRLLADIQAGAEQRA